MNTFKQIGTGYYGILKKTALILLVAAGILLVCAVLVLPFWYLAEYHPDIFNGTVAVLAAGFLVFFSIRRIRARSAAGSTPFTAQSLLRRTFQTVLQGLLLLILLTAQLFFYTTRDYLPAVALSILFIFSFGYILFIPPRKRRSS